MCPTSTTICSNKQNTRFTAIGNTTSFNITNLPVGNTCIYRVDATCGAPAFWTSNTSNAIVGYIYYEGHDLDLNGTVVTGKTSNSTDKQTAPPVLGMPRRNQSSYEEDGYLPTTKFVKGIYNVQVGGIKAFGNAVQSSSALATKLDQNKGTCVTNRTMLIGVTAQSTITTMTISLSAVNFSSAVLSAKPTENPEDPDDSNAITFSGFISITLMSMFYMFY